MLPVKRSAALRKIAHAAVALLLVVVAAAVQPVGRAQSGTSVAYTTGTYTQNFNGLPTVTPSPDVSGSASFSFGDPAIAATGLAGWYGQAASSDSFFAGNGSSATQGFYSFSTSPSNGNDALGLIANGISGNEVIGLLLINNSQSTSFSTLHISFTGELWNYGGVPNATATMIFGYQESSNPQAPLPPNGGIDTDGNLAFFYSNPNSTPGAVNGTLPANQTQLSDAISLVTPWAPGESLWLTWSFLTPVDFSPGLAIDNLSFSANGVTLASGTWTAASGSTWDTLSSNWSNGTYSDGSYVTFANPPVSGSNVVITGSGVNPGEVAVTNNTGTYTFSGGPIGGPGFITKSGSGSLVLGSSNSYFGGTVIDGGTIVAADGDASLGTAGAQVIFSGGQLEAAGGGFISSRNLIVNSGGGSFNSNGFGSSTSGSLTGSGAFTKIGAGDLTISGGVGAANSASPVLSVTGGSLTLGQGALQYFTVPATAGAFTGDLNLETNTHAEIAGSTSPGSPGLINGGGSVNLAGNNAELDDAGQNLQSTGYLEIDNNIALNSGSAAQPFAASIGVTTGTYAGQLTVDGTISGASSLTFTGPGTGRGVILLNAASTYTGDTTINDGALGVVRIGVNNALPATTQLTFGSGSGTPGALDLNGFSQTIAGLSVGSTFAPTGITNTGISAGTLTIDQAFDSFYNGAIGTPSAANLYGVGTNLVPRGADLNNINLVKEGAGALELTSNLTYSGSTQVNGGTLIVDGNISGSSGVTIGVGGTLAGWGEVYVPNGGQLTVNSGGTLAPGDNYTGGGNYEPTGSFGVQDSSSTSAGYSPNGTLDLRSGGNFAFTLGATAAGGSQASTNQNGNLDTQFFVQGTISLAGNLTGTLLSGFTANIDDLFFILIEWDPHQNESIVPIGGAFANAPSLDPLNPSTISLLDPNGSLYTFNVYYTGNASNDTTYGGNDVVLQLISVPEPGSLPCCAWGLGIALLFVRRRRRR
jgi:autotransporter-associated beta strand protein